MKFWSVFLVVVCATSTRAFLVESWTEEWEWMNMTDVAPGS